MSQSAGNILDSYRNNTNETEGEVIKPEEVLKELSEALKTSIEVVEKSCMAAQCYERNTDIRGVDNMRVHLAAFYISCRSNGEARSKRQIEKQYNLIVSSYDNQEYSPYTNKEIGKSAKRIEKILNLEKTFCTPSDYINFWKQTIDLSDRQLEVVEKIIKKIESMIEYNGYSPLPLSGSVIWLFTGEEYDAKTIANYSASTKATIKRNGSSIFHDVHTCDIDTDFETQNRFKKLSKEVKN